MDNQTTSAVAAALWYPYRAFPEREVTRWAAATYEVLAEMADVPATGVRLRARDGDRSRRRPAVRLEADRLDSEQPVVHNYGHGGSGWTLSYGCSSEVVNLVLSFA